VRRELRETLDLQEPPATPAHRARRDRLDPRAIPARRDPLALKALLVRQALRLRRSRSRS